ncbi:MAG TPA: hypothetical protein VHB99_12220 [Pirellulales bacterium]|nr:hypothetical protein [Pirellulales bacterium]
MLKASDYRLEVEIDGEPREFKVNKASFLNSQGKSVSQKTGLALMRAAERVTILTEPDSRDETRQVVRKIYLDPHKKSAKAPPRPKANSKAAPKQATKTPPKSALPGPSPDDVEIEKMDLHPAAEYKQPIPDVGVPSNWQKWYPSAKKGAYIEFADGKFSYFRYEVVDIQGDAAVIATVAQLATAISENRVRMTPTLQQQEQFAAAAADAKKPASKQNNNKPAARRSKKSNSKAAPEPAEPETETIVVGGRSLLCEVHRKGKVTTWTCSEVPFDGIVKEEGPNVHRILLDFGHGE